MPSQKTKCVALVAAAICLATSVLLYRSALSPVRNIPKHTEPRSAPWPQFGGPNRDFSTETIDLATTWPDDGPPRLWQRPLGEGYSGIVADHARLYTMVRESDDEIVIALDPDTGETIWTHRYPAAIDADTYPPRYGLGPRSTPLIVGDRIYTVGFNGTMNCLRTTTGQPIWAVDLLDEYDGSVRRWGYACSPMAINGAVVVFVGGKGASIVALDQATGRPVWKRHDYQNSYASPLLIDVEGRSQLVCFMSRHILGLDPDGGDLVWEHEHENQWRNNIVNPLWCPDNLLFVTSEGDAGGRVLELAGDVARTTVDQRWQSGKLRISHRNAVRIGEHIYATTGDFGPAFFTAFDIRTGEIAWRRRDFSESALLRAGNQLLVLEETGNLALVTPTPQGLTVHAKAEVLNEPAWTPPTLIDKRLFLRDRKKILALQLP